VLSPLPRKPTTLKTTRPSLIANKTKHMLTDNDIEKMKGVFPTKEDHARLETKVNTIEKKVTKIEKNVASIHTDLIAHDKKFEKIGNHMNIEV